MCVSRFSWNCFNFNKHEKLGKELSYHSNQMKVFLPELLKFITSIWVLLSLILYQRLMSLHYFVTVILVLDLGAKIYVVCYRKKRFRFETHCTVFSITTLSNCVWVYSTLFKVCVVGLKNSCLVYNLWFFFSYNTSDKV